MLISLLYVSVMLQHIVCMCIYTHTHDMLPHHRNI